MSGTAGSGGDSGEARDEALARIGAAERELAALAEGVRAALARAHAELARARAAVHELDARAGGIDGPSVVSAAAAGVGTPEEDGGEAGAEAPEGARLVALDLVARGIERERAERELLAEFPGVDASRLLDQTASGQGL